MTEDQRNQQKNDAHAGVIAVLTGDDVRAADDPHGYALEFLRSAFSHACAACDWDPALSASALGTPPPLR